MPGRFIQGPSRTFATAALVVAASLAAAAVAQEEPPAEKPPREHGNHGHEPRAHHDGHGGMPHDFSDAERWSAEFDKPERDAWQKPAEVIALMEIEPGMTVVDLGAGTGYFLPHLAAAVGETGRVLALDPEANLVEFMTDRAERQGLGNVEARRIPYDDPELAPGSVDRILLVNTWHHIEERPAYADKLRAALEPGGRVYVVDYTRDSPRGPPPNHRLEPETVARELALGGLEAKTVEETLPLQYVIVATSAE